MHHKTPTIAPSRRPTILLLPPDIPPTPNPLVTQEHPVPCLLPAPPSGTPPIPRHPPLPIASRLSITTSSPSSVLVSEFPIKALSVPVLAFLLQVCLLPAYQVSLPLNTKHIPITALANTLSLQAPTPTNLVALLPLPAPPLPLSSHSSSTRKARLQMRVIPAARLSLTTKRPTLTFTPIWEPRYAETQDTRGV